MRPINNSTLLVTMAIVLFSTSVFGAALAEEGEQPPAPPQDARFDFLKALAGTWQAEGDNEEMPGVTFEFRVSVV